MHDQSLLRSLIIEQLNGQHAHAGLEKAIEGLDLEQTGMIPSPSVHSVWMLVEHIRIAQHDILEFSLNPDYTSPTWPDGYWPPNEAPEDQSAWKNALASIKKDRQDMADLIQNSRNDLLKPLPHGDGQTLFREAMLIVDHNAYHIGQIVEIRRQLGIW